jgi:hypothetical protein
VLFVTKTRLRTHDKAEGRFSVLSICSVTNVTVHSEILKGYKCFLRSSRYKRCPDVDIENMPVATQIPR